MSALLALMSSGLWGSADYVAGRMSRSRSVLLVLGGSQAFGLLAVLTITAVSGGWHAPVAGYAGWAALAGLSGAAGLVMYYRALAIGTMGVVSPIAALGVIVPLVVGMVTGERPSITQGAGIALALVGVVAASGPEVRGAAGWRPVRLAAGSALLLGTAMVGIARGSQVSVLTTMTSMRMVTVTLLVLVLLRRRPPVARVDLPGLGLVGLLDVGANLAFGAAATLGTLWLASMLGSLYPIATIALARALDGERLRPVQQGGIALALAGAALISAG